jgi:hypothetical protein
MIPEEQPTGLCTEADALKALQCSAMPAQHHLVYRLGGPGKLKRRGPTLLASLVDSIPLDPQRVKVLKTPPHDRIHKAFEDLILVGSEVTQI